VLALTDPVPALGPDAEVAAWAASGAMALTGRPDGPALGPPRGLVSRLAALGRDLGEAASAVGAALTVDPLGLLGERAAIAGLHRRGTTSVGGATRLIRASDEWVAVSLARPDDVALVPAWLEVEVPGDPWRAIDELAGRRPATALVERARLLGLPAAVLGEAAARRAPIVTSTWGPVEAVAAAELEVVELASLWAGPLCGSLLQSAGANVVKVESTDRPDGARRGPPGFFDLLNAGKRSLAVDLQTAEGVAQLSAAVASADVVIEGSRPRALEHLGIHAESVLKSGGPRVWLSITGHGREGDAREWVAFGDDAAVAGGLVARDAAGPLFCADAVADPLAGLVSAAAVLEALAIGERTLLDVSLASVAAAFAGPTLPVPEELVAVDPAARAPEGRGPALG
jgi:hypothetical protein